MKTKIFKFMFLLLLSVLLGAGCDKEEDDYFKEKL